MILNLVLGLSLLAQGSQWHLTDCAAARVLDDGRVLVWPRIQQSTWDPEVILELDHPVLYLDSRGVEWTWEFKSDLVGRKDGEEVARQALRGENRPMKFAEDSFGRVWFAARDEVQWYDGKRIQVFAFTTERAEVGLSKYSGSDFSYITASPDGDYVYFWNTKGLGFWSVTGETPEFTKVDPRRGLSCWMVRHLVPLVGGHVLVFSTLDWIGPDEWKSVRPVKKISDDDWESIRHMHPKAIDDLLGRHPASWLELRVAWEQEPWARGSSGPRQRTTEFPLGDYTFSHVSTINSADGRAWIRAQRCTKGGEPVGRASQEYLFYVGGDGVPHRASVAMEQFRPEFIDVSGDGLRWRKTKRMERLRDQELFVLMDAKSEQAVGVSSFGGSDARGRVWFADAVDKSKWLTYDPLGVPSDTDPVVWRRLPWRAWKAEEESEALEVVTDLVQSLDLESAAYIARLYAILEWTAPGSLVNGELWRALSKDLSITPGTSPLRLAAVADRLRLYELALDTYGQALAAVEADGDLASRRVAMAGLLCAARANRLDKVLLFVNVTEDVEAGSGRSFKGFRIEASSEEQLTRDERRKLYSWLQSELSSRREFVGARVWMNRILDEFVDEPTTQARALAALGSKLTQYEQPDEALVLYRRIVEEFSDEPMSASAWYRIGITQMKGEAYREAMVSFRSLLAGPVNSQAPSAGLVSAYKRSGHSAAVALSRCHEALGNLEEALQYMQLAADGHRMESWCGTCSSSELKMNQDRIARLEKLLKER